VGIIRISGPKAEEIGRLLFRPRKEPCPFATHRVYHGDIVSREGGTLLDEVLIFLMRTPHSYTGDDVLEIHCHGGPVVLRTVLGEVLKAGARIAQPGEFTRRAFLNDRIDLAQAEAVADLIAAKTVKAHHMALSQLKGGLSEKVLTMRAALGDQLALLEAAVDFPDEELEIRSQSEMAEKIEPVIGEIKKILDAFDAGRMFREGLRAVIAGRPNVGKSSLLNRLLGEERAIVTPIPGTTRDFIEEEIYIEGIAVRLIDTAGVREAGNIIEKEGIEKVWHKIAEADLVIFLLDGSEVLSEDDRRVLDGVKGQKIVVAVNKADLPRRLEEAAIEAILPGSRPLWISAKYGEGLDRLRRRIFEAAVGEEGESRGAAFIISLRHKEAFARAGEYLAKAREGLLLDLSPEFCAQDIRDALQSLGEITGETTSDDILERIFSTFCIGK
jgi:tRNA modification GTPase